MLICEYSIFNLSQSKLNSVVVDVGKKYLNLQVITFLPPANEVWGKVMFLHLCVILFTGGGGLCLSMHHRSHDRGVSVRGSLSGGSLSRGVSGWGGGSLQGVSFWWGSLSGRPPYGKRAGGMHHTGMHSCMNYKITLLYKMLTNDKKCPH